MDHQRRVILQRSLVAGSAVISLLSSGRVWARWPASTFDSASFDDALADLSNGMTATESELITVDVPDTVENAAIVPVRVETTLPNVTSISLFVEDNRSPLAGTFYLGPDVRPRISTRLRLEKSGRVVAVVKSDDTYYLNGGLVNIKAFACEPIEAVNKPARKPVNKSNQKISQ